MRAVYALATTQLQARSQPQDGDKPETAPASAPLAELHVSGFDAEQIWHQVNLQTEALLRRSRRLIQRVPDDVTLLDPGMEAAVEDLLSGGAARDSEDDEDDEDMDEDDEDDEDDNDDDDGSGDEDVTRSLAALGCDSSLNCAWKKVLDHMRVQIVRFLVHLSDGGSTT